MSNQNPANENTEAEVEGFAKYEGIDGEAADAKHDKWIDVLSTDWGVAPLTPKRLV